MFKKGLIATYILFALIGWSNFAQQPDGLTYAQSAQDTIEASDDVGGSDFMFDLGVVTHEDIREQSWIRRGINFVLERVITILAATAGSAAVLFMSMGGFYMLSSGGNEDRYNRGKSMFFKALIGLVFIFGAYVLVTTVQILIKCLLQ